jgi:hypothetical protein
MTATSLPIIVSCKSLLSVTDTLRVHGFMVLPTAVPIIKVTCYDCVTVLNAVIDVLACLFVPVDVLVLLSLLLLLLLRFAFVFAYAYVFALISLCEVIAQLTAAKHRAGCLVFRP